MPKFSNLRFARISSVAPAMNIPAPSHSDPSSHRDADGRDRDHYVMEEGIHTGEMVSKSNLPAEGPVKLSRIPGIKAAFYFTGQALLNSSGLPP